MDYAITFRYVQKTEVLFFEQFLSKPKLYRLDFKNTPTLKT